MVDDLPDPIVPDDPDFLGLVVVLPFLVHKMERISFFESSQRAVPEHRVSNHHLREPNLTIYRAIN
jgi:hypothetical protein